MKELLLNGIISDIYEASYSPNHWTVVIEKISLLTDSKSSALFIQDKKVQEANGFYSHGLSDESLMDYQKYGHMDPGFLVMQKKDVGVAINIHGVERHELEAQEYYESIRLKYDIGFLGGANVLIDQSQHVGLGFHRSSSHAPFEKEALQMVSELIPHLQRALRIHREFVRLRVENSAISSGLDNLSVGLLLLDHLGSPVFINTAAQYILDSHPAIQLKGDRVVLTDKEEATRLHRKIVACLDPQYNLMSNQDNTLVLHHPENRTPVTLKVEPIDTTDLKTVVTGEPVYAAIYLNTQESYLPASVETVASRFNLTKTEIKITKGLLEGLTVEEIARQNHRSISTVRTHLRSIFEKTNTSSQSGLMRLLLTSKLSTLFFFLIYKIQAKIIHLDDVSIPSF